MGRKKFATGARMPKCLSCGMLEDEGRVLFLKRSDERGAERIEMPCVLVFSGRDPAAELTVEFRRQTGIDGQVHEIVRQYEHNAGSRKRRNWIPVLVFRVSAKNRATKPSPEFSGFRWLPIGDAKKERLGRNVEWIRKA